MKSRIFLFVLSFLFLWGTVAGAQTSVPEFAGGDGSAEKPFLIENKYQLRNLNRYLGEGGKGKHFKLVKDIIFERSDFEWGGDFYNGGKGWIPIGEQNNNSFRDQEFDGNGFSIRGLYSSGDTHVGLFGYAGNTVIRNLYLLECRFVLGTRAYRPHAGMLIGQLEKGRIEHCYCEGEIRFAGGNDSYIGGVAGEVSNGLVVNCYSNVRVMLEPSGAKQDRKKYYMGGVVGIIICEAFVRNCYADVDLAAEDAYMGGIVGCAWRYGGKSGSVENSYVRGSLSSHRALGGISSVNDYFLFKGNCVLLTRMEGAKLDNNQESKPSINRICPEIRGNVPFLNNFASERMMVKTDFKFQPVDNDSGKDGVLCPDRPDLSFWKKLGFVFGETPDAPWVFSDSGYPVIYGFGNLDAIYLRDIPETVYGKKFKALYEYFVKNRDQLQKRRSAETGARQASLDSSYKTDLEEELKKYEEENWALASVIQKELDALNGDGVGIGTDSSLPETVAKKKSAYLEACAKLEKDAAKWDGMLQVLKEKYGDDLVVIQKDCLSAKEMKLAALVERELNKL